MEIPKSDIHLLTRLEGLAEVSTWLLQWPLLAKIQLLKYVQTSPASLEEPN